MRGIAAILQTHKENSTGDFNAFKLKKNGDSALVRCLQEPDQWPGEYIHTEYQKCLPTRCKATQTAGPNGTVVENREVCILCMQSVPRTLRTFIIVGRRGESIENAVQVIEYGRDSLQEVIAQLQELPANMSATTIDFKITRFGEKTDTTYKWFPKIETMRPLNDVEKGLKIPSIDEMYPLLDDFKMQERAKKSIQSNQVEAIASADGTQTQTAAPTGTNVF